MAENSNKDVVMLPDKPDPYSKEKSIAKIGLLFSIGALAGLGVSKLIHQKPAEPMLFGGIGLIALAVFLDLKAAKKI